VNGTLQFDGVEHAMLDGRALHLAIGIFDGVHLGHRAVIDAAVRAARESGGQSAVLTFSPHPSVLLRPTQPTRMMMTQAAKARVLGQLGVGAVITQPFTPEFAKITADEFLPWLKSRLPQLAGVYVGENWRYGQGRAGDVTSLAVQGVREGLSVFSAPRISLDGEPISSSRIRAAIERGDLPSANAMLGYTYFSEGVVRPGKRLGRTLGFPTLNIDWSPELRPMLGVYVVKVSGAKSAQPLRAVANYGLRPTVEKTTEPRLEIHVLDDCPYDAGDVITAEWLHFLRPEMKFAGLGELRAQIERDREAATAYFSQ
jgi:riboflavin kinase / FMN adenylyltransferase